MDEARFFEGTVAENRHWTPALYSLRVKPPVPVSFTAGQFGRLALEIDGERVARPYSFVNAPHEPTLEFYSVSLPAGPLSPRLAALEPGDKVWVSRTGNGFLVLDEIPDSRHLWMLSTGTGVGPFLSMLKTPTPWERFERVILVHGVRTVEDAAYRGLMRTFAERHPAQFQAVHFVSRENADFALPGRIPRAVERGELEERAGCAISAQQSQVMLCGNPGMVKDAVAVLERRGLTKNRRRTPGQITVEAYW